MEAIFNIIICNILIGALFIKASHFITEILFNVYLKYYNNLFYVDIKHICDYILNSIKDEKPSTIHWKNDELLNIAIEFSMKMINDEKELKVFNKVVRKNKKYKNILTRHIKNTAIKLLSENKHLIFPFTVTIEGYGNTEFTPY